MALMARSSEMSFSLSRLRSTLRSMSIAGRSQLRLRVPELHLDGARAQRGVTEAAAGLRATPPVQRHPHRRLPHGPPPDRPRTPPTRAGALDQRSYHPPPVLRIG